MTINGAEIYGSVTGINNRGTAILNSGIIIGSADSGIVNSNILEMNGGTVTGYGDGISNYGTATIGDGTINSSVGSGVYSNGTLSINGESPFLPLNNHKSTKNSSTVQPRILASAGSTEMSG